MKRPNRNIPFPQPHKLAPGASRWALSDLLAYEAACRGEDSPPQLTEGERFLKSHEVARRYDVGSATVWRWAVEARERTAAA